MFYVLDENHNLIEAYDKEGVLAVLEQAIANGSLSGISADAGFVSKLKCCVGGATHPIAFVTQAKYNELQASGNLINNCIYYITDDTSAEDLDKALEELTAKVDALTQSMEDISTGVETVGKAKVLSDMEANKFLGANSITIYKTGIYLASIETQFENEAVRSQTGLFSVRSLDVEGSGIVTRGELRYLTTGYKRLLYDPMDSRISVVSFHLYRIGDI